MTEIANAISLEKRLHSFLEGQPGAESIDALDWPADRADSKRADFLLCERELVVEVKTIQEDPSRKIENTLAEHRTRDEFPLFYGKMELDKVLRHLPDGEDIKRRMLHRVLRSVKVDFRSADDQIAATKIALNLPNAQGLLVLLNDQVPLLSLEVMAWKVQEMLLALDPIRGGARYASVNCVWMISETHHVRVGDYDKVLPSFFLASPQLPPSAANLGFIESLHPSWASYNGVPFVHGGARPDALLALQPIEKDERPAQELLPRHEWWRRAYRANPTLRSLSETALVISWRGSDPQDRAVFHAGAGSAVW